MPGAGAIDPTDPAAAAASKMQNLVLFLIQVDLAFTYMFVYLLFVAPRGHMTRSTFFCQKKVLFFCQKKVLFFAKKKYYFLQKEVLFFAKRSTFFAKRSTFFLQKEVLFLQKRSTYINTFHAILCTSRGAMGAPKPPPMLGLFLGKDYFLQKD